MIDLKNSHHHVEFIDLPELKPLELYALFKLSRFLEPYTNRLIMMCDVQTLNGNRIIRQEVKPLNVKSCDIPDIVGCSIMTANKLAKALREKNILRRDTEVGKAYFMNPKYVRACNSLGASNAVRLFEPSKPDVGEEHLSVTSSTDKDQ